MASPYDDIIEELSKDPEFLSLSDQEQDHLVEELAKEKYGKIQNTNNLIERAINLSVAGIPSAVSPGENRPEDALTSITQFGTDAALKMSPQGRIASLIPGIPMAATTLATTGAETIRQGTKALRGEGFDASEIGKTAAITAGTEAIGRTGENFLFRTQIGKQVIEEAQKRLGKALNRLFEYARSNPQIQVSKDELLGFLQHTYDRIEFKIGPQATGLKKVIRTVENDFPDMIGPEHISKTENILGDIANFDPMKSGQLPNKVANIEVKRGRDYASGQLENMAEQAGIPEVKSASKEVSKSKRKYLSNRKMGMAEIIGRRIAGPSVLGALVGTATHNPALGAGAALGDIILQHEPTANLLHKFIVRSGLSRTGRVATAETLRKG